MKPEAVQQIKRIMDARDLLQSAVEQYASALGALKRALDCADTALTGYRDDEIERQISTLHDLVESLPRASHGAFETFNVLTETLEVLAHEVTAHEEHVPAGVS